MLIDRFSNKLLLFSLSLLICTACTTPPTTAPEQHSSTPTPTTTATKPAHANTTSVIDPTSEAVVYNDHTYQYDVLTGATPLPTRLPDGSQPKSMDVAEKEKLFYWTIQPAQGLIMGEYYTSETLFGAADSQYKAIVELVVDEGKIVQVEMDEYTPETYYDKVWAGKSKRRSGYAFFQFSKPRTDLTLVTWNNGITFLEWQILKANSLNIEFDTLTGSSNSAREGFIPAVQQLTKTVSEPSKHYYIGYAGKAVDGITPRLELVYEGDKIVDVQYDEYFADTKEAITDQQLQPFYRQSKYFSLDYNDTAKNSTISENDQFITFADKLKNAIIEQQTLNVTIENPLEPEFTRYKLLVPEIQPAIDYYVANGATHDIGTIDQKPAQPLDVRDEGIDAKNFALEVKSATYDEATQKVTTEVTLTNNGDVDYTFNTSAFHLIAYPSEANSSNENYGPLFGHMSQGNTSNNVGERVANSNVGDITIKAHESITVTVEGTPVYPTDTNLQVRLYTKKLDFTIPLASQEAP